MNIRTRKILKVILIILGTVTAFVIVAIIMAPILAIASHILPTILSKMVG